MKYIFFFLLTFQAFITNAGLGSNIISSKKGKVFILSIGINEYKSSDASLKFNNTASDARYFAQLVREQCDSIPVTEFILLNENATRDSVISVLNYINNNSNPEDHFFLNFSGFSLEQLNEIGIDEIYFYLFTNDQIDVRNPKLGENHQLSLSALQGLMQFMPAKNQLIFTEAGPNPNFKRIFLNTMLESDEDLNALFQRNRVLMMPRNMGLDQTYCKGERIEKGPLLYLLSTTLKENPELDLFDIFSEEIEVRKNFEFSLTKAEIFCEMASTMYCKIYFERELAEESGLKVQNEPEPKQGKVKFNPGAQLGISYALIVSVNSYLPDSGWKNLYNPEIDAEELSKMLDNGYNFNVTHLKDPTQSELMDTLYKIAKQLKQNDQFLFYFGGHGYYDTTFFKDGFFVLSESRNPEMDPTKQSYLPFSSLRGIFDNLKSEQVMVIVDACFGGSFDERITTSTNQSVYDPMQNIRLMEQLNMNNGSEKNSEAITLQYEDVTIGSFVRSTLERKTRVMLAAGSNKVPEGYKGKHSPMTFRLLHLLGNSGGEKPFLTSTNLYDAVKLLPSKPVLGSLPRDEKGEFIFFPKAD